MGLGRVSQVNRLKSAREDWRFIWYVCVGDREGERERMCVRICVYAKFGASGQSYVSEVAPSVALIFPSVCCHFLLCPHQPSITPFVSDRSHIVFSSLTFIFLSFPFLASFQLICAITQKAPSQSRYHLPPPRSPLELLTPFIPPLSFITLFYAFSLLYQLSLALCHPCPSGPSLSLYPSPSFSSPATPPATVSHLSPQLSF